MNKNIASEWIIKISDTGFPSVHTVVVYSAEPSLDADGEPCGISRLWVAARGYEGGGSISAYSSVASFDEEGSIDNIVSCQQAYPDKCEFEECENFEILNDNDLGVIGELWRKIDELTSFDIESSDEVFVSRIAVPDGEDFVASPGWDPDDLLEPISEDWQLFLKF